MRHKDRAGILSLWERARLSGTVVADVFRRRCFQFAGFSGAFDPARPLPSGRVAHAAAVAATVGVPWWEFGAALA